ncbi:DUF4328 domain-containing protein [Streptomyces griseorubiginosus]|uniref:DUF4328 domain-containing protein n=1 Tax=Streptomyces griseorubiginosus TaxID=67304 RepID=UPI002E8146D5|nr:DUF4328 domain-containing protein [Streptomyces griseorubiginosus]WUB45643.1 DUF4328 domain-containing protein [Streptomyces griseorubiginosus]WUB54161.1 DUF4328 domain-containing protein [Streptomyces griseorubiginosus]
MSENAVRPALRPASGSARLAVAGLGLAGAAWALRAVWHVRLAVAGEPASGPPDQGEGRHRPLNALENSYHLVSAAGDVLVVLCAAVFIGWLWRMRDNARALSGEPPRYAGIWVYASWVVPIVNLWFPRGIVADIHHRSAPGHKLPAVVNVWWALWLVGLVSGLGLTYDDSTDEIIARAYHGVTALLVGDLAMVGAAVAGILMVRTLTALTDRQLVHMGE